MRPSEPDSIALPRDVHQGPGNSRNRRPTGGRALGLSSTPRFPPQFETRHVFRREHPTANPQHRRPLRHGRPPPLPMASHPNPARAFCRRPAPFATKFSRPAPSSPLSPFLTHASALSPNGMLSDRPTRAAPDRPARPGADSGPGVKRSDPPDSGVHFAGWSRAGQQTRMIPFGAVPARAIATDAEVIVCGDGYWLTLRAFRAIPIVRAAMFLPAERAQPSSAAGNAPLSMIGAGAGPVLHRADDGADGCSARYHLPPAKPGHP